MTKDFFQSLQTFDEYYAHISDLFANGKTTGDNQSKAMLNYTKLTLQRTKRGLKTTKLSDELLNIAANNPNKNWLVISEAWCGDAGNIVPVIAKLAAETKGVTLRVMIRDEHQEMMKNYLTNGGKSIPVFATFNDSFEAQPHWGPRPKPAQEMVMQNKANPTMSHEDFSIVLQKWYIGDKTETLQKELIEFLK